MSWTRRQLIEQAFEEIGIGSGFTLAPDMLDSARQRLDAMMATWNGMGIRVGYPLTSSTLSDLDTDTAVPDSAVEAIYTNLAIKIAPTYGKQVAPETRVNARAAYGVLLQRAVTPTSMQFPETLPYGAGNQPWRYAITPFFPQPTDPIDAGADGEIEFT